jgi:hypothetical protein
MDFDEQGAKQMSDQLETFKDADLDAVKWWLRYRLDGLLPYRPTYP